MAENVKNTNFRPLELNERNVQTLFKRCLLDENNPSGECYPVQVLNPQLCGRSSELIKLSKDNVESYAETIRYLLGQIKAFHGSNDTFALQEGFMRYDGTIWTKDYDTLFKLYSMGISTVSISNFSLYKDVICSVKSSKCISTLSPKDPNYQEWFNGYEAKVKKKTLGGQEPADD